MGKKWIPAVAVILAAVICLALAEGMMQGDEDAGRSSSGTAAEAVTGEQETEAVRSDSSGAGEEPRVNFAPEQKLNGKHLRDVDSLYENQDDTSVITMYLTVSSGNEDDGTNHTWAEVNQYSVYDYEKMGVPRYKVEGLLQVGDENGPVAGEFGADQTVPNATVQIRGQSSSQNAQKNYKIRLKKNAGFWNDQRTIDLNKHQGEGMRFHNKLGFDMLRKIPQLMSLRTQFVHLYVRDLTASDTGESVKADSGAVSDSSAVPGSGRQSVQDSAGDVPFVDYGLYTQVEQLNKRALKSHGLDANGQLYKINYFEFYRYPDVIMLSTDPKYDKDKFEQYLEIKGNEDHSKLIDMLEDLNDYSIPIEDVIAKHFDMENLTYWLGYNILTGNVDSQSRNAFLYSPQNGDRWYFLCWDLDGGMQYNEQAISSDHPEYQSWQRGVSNYWGNILFRRCLTSAVFREKLQEAIDDMRTNDLTEETVREMTDAYAAVAKPYVFRMPDVEHGLFTEKEYNQLVEEMPKQLEFYYEQYQDSLKRPMPFYIGTPEVSGGNIVLNWDASYDLHNERLTYQAVLARDPLMKDVVYNYQGEDISAMTKAPGAGQYYLKVTVTNSSGNTQDAFDSVYMADDTREFGEICFYVNKDGSVTRDDGEDS